MTRRTYFPIAPCLDTRIVIRDPAGRYRSSAVIRLVPNDCRRSRHHGPLHRTSTVAVDGALTRSSVIRAPPRTSVPLTLTTGNGRR
jgi:hypothetical protein